MTKLWRLSDEVKHLLQRQDGLNNLVPFLGITNVNETRAYMGLRQARLCVFVCPPDAA